MRKKYCREKFKKNYLMEDQKTNLHLNRNMDNYLLVSGKSIFMSRIIIFKFHTFLISFKSTKQGLNKQTRLILKYTKNSVISTQHENLININIELNSNYISHILDNK